jgi:hypothetical protein
MNEAALTIADLLPLDCHLDTKQLQLPQEGSASVSSSVASFLQEKLQDSVSGALKLDVLELVAEAWSKTDELRELAERKPTSGGEPTHIFLAKHDVVCENRLNIALEFAGVPTLTDHLKLKLTAKFEGVGVTVENGYIVALDAGRGAAKAELSYSSTKLIGSTSDWVKLPGHYKLARPLPITTKH